MLNPAPGTKAHNRRSSTSNSTSSSVVTVKKAASLSSRSGSRTAPGKARATSPEQFGFQLTAVVTASSSKPTVSSTSRPSSAAESRVSNGNLNINRWSHSTASSTTVLDNDNTWKRKSNSSRRLSVGPIHTATFSAQPLKTQSPSVQSRNPLSRVGTERSRSVTPPAIGLPPDPPVAALATSSGNDSAKSGTPSSVTTPLTSERFTSSAMSNSTGDYFGESWQNRSAVVRGSATSSVPATTSYTSPSKRQKVAKRGDEILTDKPRSSKPSREASPMNPGHRAGHSRHRQNPEQNSVDTAAGSSISSTRSDGSRRRGHRSPTQKTMLSKALGKANTAVVLDNAQNFDGAVDAYAEACELLYQVMVRSSDPDDRKKLSAIRTTYANRITELREMDDALSVTGDKALPETPPEPAPRIAEKAADYEEDAGTGTPQHTKEVMANSNVPPSQQSLLPHSSAKGLSDPGRATSPPEKSGTVQATLPSTSLLSKGLGVPMQSEYMPPPLSPRRPSSPVHGTPATQALTQADAPPKPQDDREAINESTSWLDTIDESASSASSSRLSSIRFRPSIGSNLVQEIEAQFDAALSATAEAAYYEEAEQDLLLAIDNDPIEVGNYEVDGGHGARALGGIDSLHLSQTPGVKLPQRSHEDQLESLDADNDLYDEDAEEEERLLDEMTRGYVFDDFHFDKRSKSALPRQSDSSGFSGRTWGSSTNSTTVTTGTSLSTLAETLETPPSKAVPPQLPPPTGALPPPPIAKDEKPTPPAPTIPLPLEPSAAGFDKPVGPGVRDRRLSGQNARQLKIETNPRSNFSSPTKSQLQQLGLPSIQIPPPGAQSESSQGPPQPQPLPPLGTSQFLVQPLTPMTSIHSADSFQSESPATPALTHDESQNSVDDSLPVPASPSRLLNKPMPQPPGTVRKNVSASSLRMRNLSVATLDESPITPSSATSQMEAKKTAVPTKPAPSGNHFRTQTGSSGGMYLFDDHIGSPTTFHIARTHHNLTAHIPLPLEPCPESFMLRPFWLMRCLYQTIAHPKGGYLSTKLFVPRDIWRVKNVKLKALDDKVAQCDLLTAALLKLAKVDNLDADAVLDEMQSFEGVLEGVRIVLQKKLGNEVGVSSTSSMFKASNATDDATAELSAPKSTNTAAKTLASSWRKLRSKSSSAAMSTISSLPLSANGTAKDIFTMPSLPMTASSAATTSSRHLAPRRNPQSLNFGPVGIQTASYMSSLTRLFDAAQVLDGIARQVEDPGLKCSSKTHVGLELCVRTAAEFFAFYVCRFVVADVGLLLDKFVKRGTEWVLV